MTPYDQIELFGLTETGTDELPIPNDLELQGRAVGEAFDAILGTIQNTGLGSEVEPLAHAFATMFQRRATVLEEGADRLKDKITALIRTQDGSEIAEVELETAQRQFEVAYEKADALKLMAEAAAEAYERETGDAYVPVTGSRTTPRAMETGAVFEAKRLLEAADRAEAERNKVEGTFVAVAGSSDWADHARIFARLDAARERCPDLVLCHKGSKGAERIAAAWAKSRKVPQVLFRPNWNAFRKAAPFRANDEMLSAKLRGVILFGGGGIALNLAEKAEKKRLHVARIAAEVPNVPAVRNEGRRRFGLWRPDTGGRGGLAPPPSHRKEGGFSRVAFRHVEANGARSNGGAAPAGPQDVRWGRSRKGPSPTGPALCARQPHPEGWWALTFETAYIDAVGPDTGGAI